MPKFSSRSLKARKELHPLLQEIVDAAIKEIDFVILDAQRGRAEQEYAFQSKKSKARFGQSAHNYTPAVAMDLVPYPIDWKDVNRFKSLQRVIMRIAKEKGVPLTWGGTWKTLVDMPHYELKPWREWAKKGKLIND
jgi:peptidoglycan L-alanyl-D-glutamate endopeptidase CwlK